MTFVRKLIKQQKLRKMTPHNPHQNKGVITCIHTHSLQWHQQDPFGIQWVLLGVILTQHGSNITILLMELVGQWTLVGEVWSHDISKFHNTNTDVRHVKTCWKKAQKELNFRAKKCTSKHAFFFSFVTVSQRIQKRNKNEKCHFFTKSSSGTPYIQGISDSWCHRQPCWFQNLMTFGLLTTCWRHVYDFPN